MVDGLEEADEIVHDVGEVYLYEEHFCFIVSI